MVLVTATAAPFSGANARSSLAAAVDMSQVNTLLRIRFQRHLRLGKCPTLPRLHRRAAGKINPHAYPC